MSKFSHYRAFIALVFTIELRNFYGWDHVADRSVGELMATGVAFLLWSLAVEKRDNQ